MIPTGRPFFKMSGSGNDFVMVDARSEERGTLGEVETIRRVCARGTGVGARDLGVAGEGGIDDDLQALEAGAVIELDEGERFRVAARADPALEQDRVGGLRGVEGVLDERA